MSGPGGGGSASAAAGEARWEAWAPAALAPLASEKRRGRPAELGSALVAAAPPCCTASTCNCCSSARWSAALRARASLS